MGHSTGNNRNGTSPKQVFTEIGAVDLTGPQAPHRYQRPHIRHPHLRPKRRIPKSHWDQIDLENRDWRIQRERQ